MLQQFSQENGLEIVIDMTTGETFATQRGYARMSGKDERTIRRRLAALEGAALNLVKKAQVHTQGGLQGAALLREEIIVEWLPKDNPEMASKLMRLGVRAFMHNLAGYAITSDLELISDPTPEPQNEATLEDLAYISSVLKNAGIDVRLVAGFELNEAAKLKPQLRKQITEAQKLLASSGDIPELLLTPKLIGQQLGISAIKVNKLLLELGYQTKNPLKVNGKPKHQPDYVATTQGEPHAKITMATGSNGDNTTYQHLKWYDSIVAILSEYLNPET